jgi:hypothetical protein
MQEVDGPAPADAAEAPHAVTVLAWDGPSPAIVGSPATVMVGVRCAQGCALGGQAVEVRDDSGRVVGRAILAQEPQPGAEAIYCAEITFVAPATLGPARMTATCEPRLEGCLHDKGEAVLGFRVDPHPDHEVRVSVVLQNGGAPVGGAEVWMNHYLAVTDAAGEARFSLPKGAYSCSIRKMGLAADPVEVEVSAALMLEIAAAKGETREELEARLSAWESYPWS